MTRRTLLQLPAAAALALKLKGEVPYIPSPQNLAARQWFQNARFGMFIHWGVYSVLGKGEWVMNNDGLSIAQYAKLPPQFNPVQYDPTAWVSLAKGAGMRYITITSKHHDGFGMWATKLNKWNIVNATPYGKDVLKPLAEECRKQNIKLFFYHSHLDWHSPDYYPLGRTGHHSGRPSQGDFNRYLQYMDAQLTELLTNYGDVAGIWFDGMWDKPEADWHLRRTYDLIHQLQPAALIGNNHHMTPNDGEDFQMFERDLPGQNTSGFSAHAKVGDLPLESCDTMNGAWGYNATDTHFKSPKQIVHYLAKAAGNNANLLLNIGPKPDGTIQKEFVATLTQVGEWTKANGESIYGTRGGPLTPRSWGVTTTRDNKVYVHLLDWPDRMLSLPKLPRKLQNMTVLAGGQAVKVTEMEDTLLLDLGGVPRDPINTVLVMEMAGNTE